LPGPGTVLVIDKEGCPFVVGTADIVCFGICGKYIGIAIVAPGFASVVPIDNV